MAVPTRYDVSGAGSGLESGVLKNKLGLKNQSDLDQAETVLLKDSYEYFVPLAEAGELLFDLELVYQVHKYFFDPLYDWAGKQRTVNISKGDALFTPVPHLEKALKEFEKDLKRNLPLSTDTKKVVCEKLSIIHAEFNAIHPFREGNGRTIRLFMDLIALQNGYELIDWSDVSKDKYIQACKDGMVKKYDSMRKILWKVLKRK